MYTVSAVQTKENYVICLAITCRTLLTDKASQTREIELPRFNDIICSFKSRSLRRERDILGAGFCKKKLKSFNVILAKEI